jgi:hypothetical protein
MDQFAKSVFINCPFDRDYDPILRAIIFCVVRLGFQPRLSREVDNAGLTRLDTIQNLIEVSKFSIHDLSRCEAKKIGEISRLNMPFELGIDFGCKRYGDERQRDKAFLVLDEQQYRIQKALSDINGSDIQSHGGSYIQAATKVRNWLIQTCSAEIQVGPSRILRDYEDFQIWHYQLQLANGFSDDDIKRYPIMELMTAMKSWLVSQEKRS